jgi:hypothetical protein
MRAVMPWHLAGMTESELRVAAPHWHTGSHTGSGMPDQGTLHEFTIDIRANTPAPSRKFSGTE